MKKMMILLLCVVVCCVPAYAMKVWYAGYDEFTDTYVVAVYNDADENIENVEMRIDDGEYNILKYSFPAQARVNYRISEGGEHNLFLRGDGIAEEHFPLILTQDEKIDASIGEYLYTLREQQEELEQIRELKAMERERLIELQKVQQSSQSEIVSVDQEFDMNALFVRIIIILFIVVGGLALYEFVMTRSREGRA